MICSVEGCDKKHSAKGYCQQHYLKYRYTQPCTIEGCDKTIRTAGLCESHYKNALKNTTHSKRTKKQFIIRTCIIEECSKRAYENDRCIIHHFKKDLVENKCIIDDCNNKYMAKGYCRYHYYRVVQKNAPKSICRMDGCTTASQKSGFCTYHYNIRTRGICSEANCDKPIIYRTLCFRHYDRWRKYGEIKPDCKIDGCSNLVKNTTTMLCPMHWSRVYRKRDVGPSEKLKYKAGSLCIINGCLNVHSSGGKCKRHWLLFYVDNPIITHDILRLCKRTIDDNDGYTHVSIPGLGVIYEHRFIMMLYIKRVLHIKEQVHHKNGLRTDNRIENLELWSTSHPAGQRVEDKIAWAIEFLEQYGYEVSQAEEQTA